jgi:hypothetical protein
MQYYPLPSNTPLEIVACVATVINDEKAFQFSNSKICIANKYIEIYCELCDMLFTKYYPKKYSWSIQSLHYAWFPAHLVSAKYTGDSYGTTQNLTLFVQNKMKMLKLVINRSKIFSCCS